MNNIASLDNRRKTALNVISEIMENIKHKVLEAASFKITMLFYFILWNGPAFLSVKCLKLSSIKLTKKHIFWGEIRRRIIHPIYFELWPNFLFSQKKVRKNACDTVSTKIEQKQLILCFAAF